MYLEKKVCLFGDSIFRSEFCSGRCIIEKGFHDQISLGNVVLSGIFLGSQMHLAYQRLWQVLQLGNILNKMNLKLLKITRSCFRKHLSPSHKTKDSDIPETVWETMSLDCGKNFKGGMNLKYFTFLFGII